ncbi:MAG TPA: cytochrome c [Candidatus Elarobacter sp.]|nr:cytochrome c [Candidatus Elarobacter sp.]HEV2739151.1 cytochrome c [Candidatus Elarobacter sp.]
MNDSHVDTKPSARNRAVMLSKPLARFAAGALAVLVAAGCAKGGDRSSSTAPVAPAATSAGAATAASKLSGAAQGDAAHGKTIFIASCAACHGQTGAQGTAGPSLKNEKSRKNYAQTVAWIKEPLSPMPKLYPDSLSAKDVADVAAFVQTL